MSYLERLREAEKILESGPPPSAKSAKTPLEPTSGTFGTTPPGPFQDFFSDSAHRLWWIRHADGRCFSHSFTPPVTAAEVRAEYPEALEFEEDDE